MFNDLTRIHPDFSGKLGKGLFALTLTSVLTACGGGGGADSAVTGAPTTENTSQYVDDPSQPETAITGRAVKGTISNGIVRAYEVVRQNGDWVFDPKPYRNAVKTDASGNYSLRFRGKVQNATFMVEISADANTRMICDVVEGCLDADGNMTPFGQSFPLANNFQLLGIISGVDAGETITAHMTPLTHMAVNYAMTLNGGLSTSNINSAKRHVESMMELDANALDLAPVDIAQLNNQSSVSKAQLETAIVSSAFLGLVNTPQWNDIADVLAHVSNKMIESGALRTASQGLDAEISLQDVFYEASNIAADLMAAGNLTAHSNLINQVQSETTLSYEKALSSVTPPESIAPVTILSQPQSVTVTEGAAAQFAVVANGGGTLSYQWRRNGIALSGQTAASLSLRNVSAAQAGAYDVIVSNSVGSVTSLTALLTVNPAPVEVQPVSISSQPSNVIVDEGANAQFSVGVMGGGPISYQWFFGQTALSGATTNTLSLSAVQLSQAGSYRVRVSNSANTVFSNFASLTINAKPVLVPVSISSAPQSRSVNVGEAVQFSVLASGSGTLSYQWSHNGAPINGANASTLALASAQLAQAGTYTVRVSNGTSEASASAVLSVAQPVSLKTIELNWSQPDQREDGSYLASTEISGYVIKWGTASGALGQQLNVNGPSTLNAEVPNLTQGSYYFAIATVDSRGIQGAFSDEIRVDAM